ncbi:MAG: GlyGly-CTERM sorting domain-containing protein [Lysobacterales bacterium]|nr:MAG: GlyGly-CTERM sorting domain-containing protein [Xanthomonadales bacterium]
MFLTALLVPGGLNMNARLLASLAAASFVIGSHVCAAQPAAGTEERVTRSAAGPSRDHAADELRDPTSFELLRRQPTEITVKPRVPAGKGTQNLRTYGDSWIYDATADIFADRDSDGYYSYLRVRFDADTIYDETYVYAEIYVSADGTAWEHLYSTNDFAIWGSDPDDDYEVETELVSGYSTGLYDVLVELYDADTGELLDEYGPNESPLFSMVPLEDAERDGLVAPPPVTVVHQGGGGAVSWLALAGLLGALALRRRRLMA